MMFLYPVLLALELQEAFRKGMEPREAEVIQFPTAKRRRRAFRHRQSARDAVNAAIDRRLQ